MTSIFSACSSSRRLLSLAALAASAFSSSSQAQSQVAIYGAVSTDFVSANNVYNGGVKGRLNALDSGTLSPSRIGFRGVEDLGGGMAATFGMESGFAADNGGIRSGQLFGRGSTVGLKGNFGALTLGRQWNLNDDLMGDYFMFNGYAAFRYTEFDWLSDLTNNSIKYYFPKLGNLQVGVLYAAGEQAGRHAAGNTAEASASYVIGGVNLALSHHRAKAFVGDRYDRLTSFGINYTAHDWRARIGYAVSNPEASGLLKAASYDVGIDYFGISPAVRLSLDYVGRDQKGTGNDSAFIRLLADYSLSRRTGITANLVYLRNKGAAAERFYGSGAPGQSQSVATLGVRHNF